MKTFYKLCSMLLCSAFLLGGCTKETQTDGGDPRPGDDSIAEVREVMMTLKSQLVLQKGATKANATAATTTKAETSIATAAENAISTLDVYVFGAESENGDYTFLERFAYRADSNDKLPKDAKELQPNTTGADGKETTALIKLKKGLFVKLYCIANDTTLVDPATDKVVKAADFTPDHLYGKRRRHTPVRCRRQAAGKHLRRLAYPPADSYGESRYPGHAPCYGRRLHHAHRPHLVRQFGTRTGRIPPDTPRRTLRYQQQSGRFPLHHRDSLDGQRTPRIGPFPHPRIRQPA